MLNRDVKGPRRADGAADPTKDDGGDGVEGHVRGRFGHKHEGFVEEVKDPFAGFDAALYARLAMMGREVLRRGGDAFVGEAAEDGGDDGMLSGFVFRLQAAGVFGREGLFGEVEFDDDFFFIFELHDEERVASLALSERGVEANDDKGVDVVRFGEQQEFLDGGKLDLVVVGFAAQAEGGVVHVNIEPASVSRGLGG